MSGSRVEIDLREDRKAIEKLISDSIAKCNDEIGEPVGQFAIQYSAIGGYVLSSADSSTTTRDEGFEPPGMEHFGIIEIDFKHWEEAAESDDGGILTMLDGSTVEVHGDDGDELFTEPFGETIEQILRDAIEAGVFKALNTKPGFILGFESTGGEYGEIFEIG